MLNFLIKLLKSIGLLVWIYLPSFLLVSIIKVIGVEYSLLNEDWITLLTLSISVFTLSLLTIHIISQGKLEKYGFKKCNTLPILKALTTSLILSIPLATIASLITVEYTPFRLAKIQQIIFAWILPSISEETAFRGLIQNYLAQEIKKSISLHKIEISIPSLISALLFALLHIALITTGMPTVNIIIIVLTAIIMSLISGYYMEKSGSLIPSIVTHATFNAIGSIIAWL